MQHHYKYIHTRRYRARCKQCSFLSLLVTKCNVRFHRTRNTITIPHTVSRAIPFMAQRSQRHSHYIWENKNMNQNKKFDLWRIVLSHRIMSAHLEIAIGIRFECILRRSAKQSTSIRIHTYYKYKREHNQYAHCFDSYRFHA